MEYVPRKTVKLLRLKDTAVPSIFKAQAEQSKFFYYSLPYVYRCLYSVVRSMRRGGEKTREQTVRGRISKDRNEKRDSEKDMRHRGEEDRDREEDTLRRGTEDRRKD